MIQSLWMLVAACFFAVMSALVKTCSLHAGTFEIVFFRAFLTLIFIYVLMRAEGVSPKTKYPVRHFIRSICGAIAFTSWFAAMGHLPLGTAVTLSYTGPIFIALTTIALCVWYKRRVPWILIAAVALGFAGICVMMHPSVAPGSQGWMAIALITGVLAPPIFMTVQKLGRAGEPSSRIVFYFMLISSIWGLGGVFLIEGGFHAHETSLWLMLLGVGICSTVAQLAMTQAYAKGDLLISACLNFATIPLAELLSVIVFKETLSSDALIGMGMILVAGLTAAVCNKRRS